MHNTEKLRKMLEIIQDEMLPLAESEVTRGNHMYGGAVLRADTMTSVMTGSDNRIVSPLLHGEIDTLNRFFKLPVRPATSELIFLSTHAPCPMCAAAIAWSGIKELWVLFDYKDLETDETTPDKGLKMFHELYGTDGIRPENAFFTKHNLKLAVSVSSAKDELQELLDEIEKRYSSMQIADFEYPL